MRNCLFSLLVLLAVGSARADEPDARQLAQKADQLVREKKYDEALDAIDQALRKEPSNDRYLMLASEIERRAGRFAAGVEHALAAIKINDKVGDYYLLVAANAYGNQDPELALRYCRKLIDKGKDVFGAGAIEQAKSYEDMLVKRTYTLTWNLDPSNPRKRKFIGNYLPVAVPKGNLPYQSVEVQVKGARSHRLIKGDVNDVLRVVPDGKKTFQIITKVTLTPVSYKAKLAKAEGGSLPPQVRPFLEAAEGFDPTSPKLKKIAASVKGKTSAATVKNILAWMAKHIEYKKEIKSIAKLDFKSVEEILDRGHAECRGYTILFAALCRAAGVPARPVWGVYFSAKGYDSHNWDEVYISGCGWVPVDPQLAYTFGWLPVNCVRMFMDLRKSAGTDDNLPLLNLVFMNGDKLRFERAR